MKYLILLPLAATAAAIAANARGFILGGPREYWELAVSAGYLAAWVIYLAKGRGWKLAAIWWTLTALCAGAGFIVMAFDLDGFLLIFPALGLLSPLSGLAVLTGRAYVVFYGVLTVLGVIMTAWALGKRKSIA